jgi:hypothetical protein
MAGNRGHEWENMVPTRSGNVTKFEKSFNLCTRTYNQSFPVKKGEARCAHWGSC